MLFLSQARKRYGGGPAAFSEDALEVLKNHPWPGNIRELNHVVERAALMASGDRIDAKDLELNMAPSGMDDLESMPLEQAERLLIQAALERNAHNVLEAARELGLSRSAMYRRLEKHGLNETD
jgi:DNA-binding NtrC family response regulator